MLGLDPSKIKPGQISYHLRRLRLHGLITRIEETHRYKLTPDGLRIALFYQRTYARVIRPGLSKMLSRNPAHSSPQAQALQKLQLAMNTYLDLHAA
jgi:DNA-binding IclR family transcriptional regulator